MNPLIPWAVNAVAFWLRNRDTMAPEIKAEWQELLAQLTPALPRKQDGTAWTFPDLLHLAERHNALTAEIRLRHQGAAVGTPGSAGAP